MAPAESKHSSALLPHDDWWASYEASTPSELRDWYETFHNKGAELAVEDIIKGWCVPDRETYERVVAEVSILVTEHNLESEVAGSAENASWKLTVALEVGPEVKISFPFMMDREIPYWWGMRALSTMFWRAAHDKRNGVEYGSGEEANSSRIRKA